MPKIELIIFDFDGVVVDSENLSSAVHAETLLQIGVPLSIEEFGQHYTGLDFDSILNKFAIEYGQDKADKFAELIEENYAAKMTANLQLMPHLLSFLKSTRLAICIASNSKMRRLVLNQEVTEIEGIFNAVTFSADMVERPKPAPDLFLHAATKMGFATTNCLVIEDGAHGIKAAMAAGMKAIGFYGGSHCKVGHDKRLANAGAVTCFKDMHQLAKIIKDIDNGEY